MDVKEHVYLANEMTMNDILNYMVMSGVTSFQRKCKNFAIACDAEDVRDWGDGREDSPIMNYTLQMTEFKEQADDIENAGSFAELVFNSEFEIIECSFQFGMPEDGEYVCVMDSTLQDDIYYAEGIANEILDKFVNAVSA